MKRFSFAKFRRTLLIASAFGAVFSSWAVAQDSSFIPIKVNVDATVTAVPNSTAEGAETVTLALTANRVDTLRLPYVITTGVIYFGGQRHANAPKITANSGGNVTVNLPAQSYKNAEVALYTVNGKRVMSGRVSSSNAVNNISRTNIATGVYLLSVKGANNEAVTARLTHSGGGLSINTAFTGGSGNAADARKMSKQTADEVLTWTVSVSATADDYKDSVFTVRPAAENNPLLNITLQELSSGGDGSYDFVEIGGLMWMKKNLNIETAESWCNGNSTANCDKYGRLYTWEAAKNACPSGWRLPDTADWNKLVNAAGGSSSAGEKLKATSGWSLNGNGTNDFGFSALPGGNRRSDGRFDSADSRGYWWTATESDSDNAYYRYMYDGNDNVDEYDNYKSNGYSVRCVQ